MVSVLNRLISSRKIATALVTILGDIGLVWGFDVPADQMMQGVGLAWNLLGLMLTGSQAVLDFKWGSPSDGTG